MDSILFGVLGELREQHGDELPEVLHGLSNPEVKEASWLRVKITPAMWQSAEVAAEQRKRGHDHCRKTEEDHGSDVLNLKYERYGVMAEMLVADGLERDGFKPEGYRFVARRALSEPDFLLNGLRFDVKAVEPDGRYVCITDRKHGDPKCRPDFYIAVLFENEEEATIALIPASDVDKWERLEGGQWAAMAFRFGL